MILYGIIESIRRIIQMFFGTEVFDLPILYNIRCVMYKLVFKIGNCPTIGARMRFFRSHKLKNGKVIVGNNVLLAKEAMIDYSGCVIIEDNVWISERVQIHTHTHTLTDRRIYGEGITTNSIILKSGCWIGAGAIILPSVRYIGKNSVVGAGAVVTKNVEDNTIVAGNPASLIRRLQDE